MANLAAQLVTVFASASACTCSAWTCRSGSARLTRCSRTVVFVLAVLAQVGALVIMLWLCRPAGDHETALDVAALAIGPFLAVYARVGAGR